MFKIKYKLRTASQAPSSNNKNSAFVPQHISCTRILRYLVIYSRMYLAS